MGVHGSLSSTRHGRRLPYGHCSVEQTVIAMPILALPPLNTTIAAVLTVTACAWGLPAATLAA